jgi:CheY-like chemotaxis protein
VDANAEILADLLELENIVPEHAANWQEAVEMFGRSPAGYYDAILMDVRMPVMDGLMATEKIRSLDRPDAKTIPIIALTANAFDEDVQRSLQVGMNAHLTKPVESEQLFQTLGELIYEAEKEA